MLDNRDVPDATSNHGLLIKFGMRMIVKSCRTNKSISCELIGMRCGKYLVLRMLEDNYPAEFHRKGELLTVRYVCAGCVFDFSSRVIKLVDSPDKLFFVESQETVESCNSRSSERIDCFVPVQLSSGETVFNATVVNVSTQGCLCVVDNFFDISLEKPALISIRFFNGISIDGEVRFTRRQFLHNHNIGIRFRNMDNDNKKNLKELIPALSF
ncbi:protein YcgR [Candidatus Electrothrix marina]|uniref:Protein YcgR n=1 Tax=Candidatus Electrothrix marina TaxID=1859130 RepID=A0A444JCM5_9BACT|nr:protein YcgR [Candidatus Electrothrix marina]